MKTAATLHDDSFRAHYQIHYKGSDTGYERYQPAYEHGYQMANNELYNEYNTWEDIRVAAKHDWEEKHPDDDSLWEEIKEAVRHGWERAMHDKKWQKSEEHYRQHYQDTYESLGRDFAYYRPGYRYGYVLAYDTPYRNYNDWKELEPLAREEWEQNYGNKNSMWEEIKESVQFAWSKATGEREPA